MKLKTLKDIEFAELNLEDYASGTFKEVERVYTKKRVDRFREKLKQEAIKHIKSGTMVEGAKLWAMGFFNITEKDLKGDDKFGNIYDFNKGNC